jgi:hypothetical protein
MIAQPFLIPANHAGVPAYIASMINILYQNTHQFSFYWARHNRHQNNGKRPPFLYGNHTDNLASSFFLMLNVAHKRLWQKNRVHATFRGPDIRGLYKPYNSILPHRKA